MKKTIDDSLEEMEKDILNDINSNPNQYIKNNNLNPKINIENLIFNKKTIILIFIIFLFLKGEIILNFIYNNIIFLTNLIPVTKIQKFILVDIIYFGILIIFGTILIVYLLPIKEKERQSIIRFEIIILIIILILNFGYYFYSQDGFYSSSETINNIQTEVNSSYTSLFNTIKCSFDPACIEKKMNSNKAKTNSNNYYSISLKNPYSSISISSNDLKNGLNFIYNIKTTDNIFLENVKCYYQNDSNLISTYELNQRINTNGKYIPISFNCNNLDKIKLKQDKETEKIKFILKLRFKLNTTFTQEIPIIDYNKFIEEKSEIAKNIKNPTYYTIKTELDDYTSKDKSFIESNNALNVDNYFFKESLPILVHDGVSKKINLPLEISTNKENDFGELMTAKIISINVPNVLKLENDNENFYKKTNISKKKKIFKNIYFIENDDFSMENLEQIQDLKIKTEAEFEKENKIVLNIFNVNYNKNKNQNSSIQNIIKNNSTENKTK